jgi:hypothetical protein
MTKRLSLYRSRYGRAVALGTIFALVLFDGLSSAGAHGVFGRMWAGLTFEWRGPLWFRFVLQPVMAVTMAIRDGIKDAGTGRSPYFWTVLTNPAERTARLLEGLRATVRVILLALAMDAAYQVIVFRRFYLGEAIGIAILLAFVPYLLLRGPVARATYRLRR